jgi:outer membrane receptor protein involved in Fe transport
MRGRGWFLAVLTFSILFARVECVFGQAGLGSAQLNGTVLDEKGGSVAKAAIALRDTETNSTYPATSSASGFYVIPNLPPGHYELKVSYSGFGNYTQTGIELRVGQVATIDVTLKIASVGEQVTVSTEAQTVEPTKTEISQVIETRQIGSLPVSGRLFTDFALLTPGVATGRTSLGTTFTEFEITQISFGGMRSFSNEITVDGADFINSNTGVQRATPPQEAVQEFRVVNNSFGSEYGRALGGIVNVVTKSGTNELHGSVYDYLQNSSADARSLLQPAPDPHALRSNQFGGTFGGRIRKDKTFFFMNYEGQRRAESPILPPDLRTNIAAIDQAKAYLGLAPENLGTLKTKNNDYGFVRLDHQLTANQRLSLRYNVEDARDLNQLVGNTEDGGGVGTPSGGRNLFIRDQSVVGTLDSSVRPNLINTALVQYARRHYNFPGATGEPDLDIPNDLSFGHNFGTLDSIYESRLQFADSVAWVKGKHLAKFGFDSNNIWDATIYPGFTPARIILPGLNCLVDFANFIDKPGGPPLPQMANQAPCPLPPIFFGDAVTFYGVALARTGYVDGQAPLNNATPLDTTNWSNAFAPGLRNNYQYTLNHGYYGFFAQDQWRMTPKFTLNYGLRYDLETGLGDQIASYYGAVQPRVGFAYSPDGKTVIRAGFGLFDDRNNMTFFFITGNQKTVSGFLPGINLPMVRKGADTGGWQLNAVNLASFLPGGVTCTPGLGIPVLGPPPAPPLCLDAPAVTAASILTTGLYPTESITGICPPACTAGAGGMDRNHSKLPYAEQASLEIDRQLGKGLTVDVGYLFVGAHRLVLGNGLNTSCPVGTSKPGNPAGPVGVPGPPFNSPAAQGWVNPDGTISSCSGSPALLVGKPYFSGNEFSNGGFLDYNDSVVNAVYHGLTLQAIERFGKYFNLNANYTYSHIIDDGNFTTFINLPQNQFDQRSERGNSNQDVRHRFVTNFTAEAPKSSFLRNFALSSIITVQSGRPFTMFVGGDTNGDTNPVTDRVGLSSRNSYIGQPLRTWDFRLSRYFVFNEKKRLDLIFDAFNLLNRQNIDEVSSVYGSPVFCGAVPTHFGDAPSLAIQQGTTTCPTLASLTAAGQIPAGALPGGFFVPPGPNGSFGTPRTMMNPRQLQLAVKFSF